MHSNEGAVFYAAPFALNRPPKLGRSIQIVVSKSLHNVLVNHVMEHRMKTFLSSAIAAAIPRMGAR